MTDAKQKRAEYMRAWRASRSEAQRAAMAEYDREYRLKNKDAINAARRERLAGNEAALESRRSRYHRYRDHERAAKKRAKQETPERFRDAQRKCVYGVPYGWYAEQVERQGGRCALCSIHVGEVKLGVLCIDHCHETGRVRGLLCHSCNTAVGVLEKYRGRLEKMLSYADEAVAYEPAQEAYEALRRPAP